MKWNKFLAFMALLLPVLMLGPTLGYFHTPVGSPFSDLAISHYPNTYFLQRTILEEHEIPLWNPYILGGYPFDADPLSGLWYPLGWISLLFPLPLGINLVILLHIIAGGIGVKRYLEIRGYSTGISVFGMLCFVLLPKIYAHFGAGHVSLIYAFCLTPWLLWSEAIEEKKRLIVQGGLFAAIILADIRWLPYALLGWMGNKVLFLQKAFSWKDFIRNTLTIVTIAIGITAVYWMPFSQFASLSTRIRMTTADNLMFSLPPGQIINLFLPVSGGTPEWVIYVGGAMLLLSIVGAWYGDKIWRRVWVTTALLCLLWAFGAFIPGMQLVAQLPGMSSLRVPPRSMFLGDLALIFLAVEGLHHLETWNIIGKAFKLTGFGLMLLVGSISIFFAILSGKDAFSLLISAGLTLCVFIVINFLTKLKLNNSKVILVVGFLLAIDLILADLRQFSVVHASESVNLNPTAIDTIERNIQEGRIYSPSYSIPQDVAIVRGWKLANGIHPLQLEKYVNQLAKASGVPNIGYSVVQPPLKTGNPYEDNRYAQPDADELAKIDVSIVAASFPLSADGLLLLYQDPTIWIYKNTTYVLFPRMVDDDGKTAIQSIIKRANHISYAVDTSGGTIQLNQIRYPGLIVIDNGKVQNINDSGELYFALELDAGNHEIQLWYRPVWMYVGLTISLLAIIFSLLILRLSSCKQNTT